MTYKLVKFGKSGTPYFNEFNMDACEASHTVFIRFTRHDKLRGFLGMASERHDGFIPSCRWF